MSTDAFTLLFALLAVAAQATVAGAAAVATAGRFHHSARRWGARLREQVGPEALGVAAVVAGVATLGSLYLSEIAGFPACRLCWVQRAFMYPLVPALALAAWRGAYRLGPWLAGWAVLGGSVSVYHMLLERFPSLESTGTCDPSNPCSLIWVERFGYLTIPTMALSAFALIAVLALAARPAAR